MSTPTAQVQIENIVSLIEFEELGLRSMSEVAAAYVCGGAADELTLRANTDDWKRIRLKPKALVDVSEIDLKTELFGQKLELPIMLAPAAFHRLCHPLAELATVAG